MIKYIYNFLCLTEEMYFLQHNMDNNNMFDQGQEQQPQFQQQQFQQQPYQQQPYQQQAPYQAPTGDLEEPVSFGEWMITLLIMMIPCVNIVMMFVWAFGNSKKSKSNYFKASLVWALISIVIMILFMVIGGATFAGIMNQVSYY